MSEYRRWFVPGGTFFFTIVTFERRCILTTDTARACLRESIVEAQARRPFRMVAIVLLPDHWHTVWALPPGDDEYSRRIAAVKAGFTRRYLDRGGLEGIAGSSRARRGERGVWQRRFWEHTCRDEDDVKRCVDYVHWNPRKHKLVRNVADWRHSSFHRFVSMGEYGVDWGGVDPCPDWDQPE